MIHSIGIGASLLLSLLFLAPQSPPAPADAGSGGTAPSTPVAGPGGNCADVTASGEPACNGTTGPVEASVCKTATVQVSLGNKVIGVSVSQAGQTCYTMTLQPGECMAIQYNFECCKSWFFGWSCESTGTEVVSW
jgi:hypothetical protein